MNGILAPTGTVILTANQAITELGTDGAADITADELLFDAGTGIGTSGNPLEFKPSNSRARASPAGSISQTTPAA